MARPGGWDYLTIALPRASSQGGPDAVGELWQRDPLRTSAIRHEGQYFAAALGIPKVVVES